MIAVSSDASRMTWMRLSFSGRGEVRLGTGTGSTRPMPCRTPPAGEALSFTPRERLSTSNPIQRHGCNEFVPGERQRACVMSMGARAVHTPTNRALAVVTRTLA